MATLPQSPPAGKSLALVRTAPPCPCCATPLRRWALSVSQPPSRVFWCGGCLRPVCLEPPAGLDRPGVEVAHASA